MMNRRDLLGAGLVAGAAGLAGCAPKAADSRIAIGYQRNGLLYLAHARGDFEQRLQARGISLTWAEFASGPPLIEALNAGAIDFGITGDTPVIYAQAAGVDFRIVAAQVYPSAVANAFLTPPKSAIATPADLKGKRIGFTKGSAAEVSALAALQSAGLTRADVTDVTLAPGDGVAALGSGSIDALFTWDPYFSMAQARIGAGVVRFDRAGLLAVLLYLARGPLTAAPATALTTVLDELKVEAAWANAHLDLVKPMLSEATRMPVPEITRLLANIGPTPYALGPPDAVVRANQQRVADILLKAGSISAPLDTAKVFWDGWKSA
jgi:sulfonate transport system substrate-binding protein